MPGTQTILAGTAAVGVVSAAAIYYLLLAKKVRHCCGFIQNILLITDASPLIAYCSNKLKFINFCL